MRGGSTPTPPSPYYPVGADCVLYLDFGDGLESAVDHSIYGNDGTVYGATFGTYGLTFDGIDDIVVIEDNDEMDIGTGSFSWWFWINYTSGAGVTRLTGSDYGSGLWYYGVRADGYNTIYDDAWTPYYGTGTYVGAAEEWHLMGYVVDRVAQKYYRGIDGVWLESSLSITTESSITATNIGIGGIPMAPTNTPYNGIVGQTIWWNVFKSQTIFTDYYSFTKARYGL
jgi:hypothetical protein